MKRTSSHNKPKIDGETEPSAHRTVWNKAVVASSWIGPTISSALLPNGTGLSATEGKSLTTFAAIVCALVTAAGTVISAMVPSQSKTARCVWGLFALVGLVTTGMLMLRNWHIVLENTCGPDKAGVRILRPQGNDAHTAEFKAASDQGLKSGTDDCAAIREYPKEWWPDKVWSRTSLDTVRRNLVDSHVICFAVFSAAVYCLAEVDRVSRAIKMSTIDKPSTIHSQDGVIEVAQVTD